MIYVLLSDGTRRALDNATVTLTWETAEGADQFKLSDVQKLVLIEPELLVRPGNMGGMPVVAQAFRDLSDLVVEVPMPADYATNLGSDLQRHAKDAREAAVKIRKIQERGGIAVAQTIADVMRAFGA